MYYDYNTGTFNKDYLGNYYSDGTHTGSFGLGGTYTIANDNNDDYQLIQTPDYYSLQAWWLSGNSTMYGDDVTQAGSELTISGSGSNIWIANVAATGIMNFPGSDTWTGQLVFSSAPTNGHTFTAEIGYSTNGSDFTTGGPDATITADGSARIYTFATDASAFSVTTGKYLALRITNNNAGSDYDLLTGGAWCYCSSPDGSSEYTLPIILSTFTAQFIENTPTIYWTTQSETDNMGWLIYRSAENDFSSSDVVSDMIEGHGTTTQQQFYTYEDQIENPKVGDTYYYWLESIDYGGIINHYDNVAILSIPDYGNSGNSGLTEPERFGLLQNEPNPVINTTRIAFKLHETTKVDLAVYNLKGQLVKKLYSGVSSKHTVMWDGKDEWGKALENGVYLYRLLLNSKTKKTKKLILMK